MATTQRKLTEEEILTRDILLAVNNGSPLGQMPPWSSYEEILTRLKAMDHELTEEELLPKLRKLAGDKHVLLSMFIRLDEDQHQAQLMLCGISRLCWLTQYAC